MARRRWRDDSMVRARWILLALGAAAVAVTFVVSEDVTVRLTAGMAAGLGALVLGASEMIIVRTRSSLDTRLAAWRQGSIDR